MSNQISIVGTLSNGVLILNQENTSFPANPTLGTLVIKGLSLYTYITIAGVTNWYPLVQKKLNSSNYIGEQNTLSNTWLVQHNLNTIKYHYQVQDINNNLLTPINLIPIDNDSFELVFANPCIGNILVISIDDLFIDQLAIGDGNNVQITKADQEQLNFVAGTGVNITFDNITKDITINALQSNGVMLDYGKITSNNTIITTMDINQVIDSFSINEFRTVKYLMQITNNTDFQVIELVSIHDGVNTYLLNIDDFFTNNELASFDCKINNNVFQLLVTPLITNLVINVMRTGIVP